jgi:protocatechuate 3,4-dioxygenase beta subunit
MSAPLEQDDDDDRPIGRLLTRREMLVALAGVGAALLAGCDLTSQPTAPPATPTTAPTVPPATPAPAATATTAAATATTAPAAEATATGADTAGATTQPSCVARPELTEGPYFVDEMLNRSDIRSDPSDGAVKEGAPLRLTFRVSQLGAAACAPLAGAQVDIWHCDALGVYSDVTDRSFNTKGKKFLRGYQVTDANGAATFTTIYPGWYQGRAVHIHFKIRTNPGGASGHEFTSQLFFDDALSDRVYAQAPYAAKGLPTLRNSGDGIYRQGGSQLLLTVAEDGQGGYAATFDIGLQIS